MATVQPDQFKCDGYGPAVLMYTIPCYMLSSCAAFRTMANYKCVRTRITSFCELMWSHAEQLDFKCCNAQNYDISTQQIGISGLASTQWCWVRDHSRLLTPHQRKAYPSTSSIACLRV